MTPASDIDAERADLLRRTLSGATLAMVALSWPLWIDLEGFPAIPLVGWFPDYPRPWSWAGLAVVGAGLSLGTTRRAGRLGVGAASVAMGWLVLGDQLRLQPWVYQFLVMGSLLIALSPRSALAFCRIYMASVYLHSGLSKLDASFVREMGPLFVATLARVFRADVSFVLRPGREPMVLVMPGAEVVVAALLVFRRTRLVGFLGAALIHLTLLAILGPWGLGHSAIVLVWNVAMVVEEWFLFGPVRGGGTEALAWTTRERLAAVPLALVVILPAFERAGLLDSWPSHALYASHCERSRLIVAGDPPASLPSPLRLAFRPVEGDPAWMLNPTDWTLAARGVPVYPQIRYTNGLAEWVAGRVAARQGGAVSVDHELRADLRTGRREHLRAGGRDAIRDLAGRFWFNAHPKGEPGR